MAEWSKALDLKSSVPKGTVGSNPTSSSKGKRMFGNKALVLDEFRLLLKSRIGYNETDGSVGFPKALTELSLSLGVNESLILLWLQGLARPTPHEENRALSVLKALNNIPSE